MGEFWLSVWSGVISGLLSSFIITGIIATVVYLYRKPSISMKLDITTSIKTKTLIFSFKNTGKMSLMPDEAQWFVYFDFDSFEIEGFKGFSLVATDKGAFYEYTGFNSTPCHPGSSTEVFSVTVRVKDSIKYEFIDEVPFFCTVYTNKGVWKPSIFSKQRRIQLIKKGTVESTAYIINEITV